MPAAFKLMTYFLHGFDVFLGVLAGTAVTILVQSYLAKRAQTQQTQNLRFELELNVAKINAWLADLEKYRDAVAADSLHNWFGYFDLGKIFSVTASAMFGSGLLYQKLDDKDDIAALQELFQELSQKGAEFMNNRLCANKEILIGCRTQNRMNDWLQTHKPDAVRDVEFWKNKLFDHRRKLQAIIEKLPQK